MNEREDAANKHGTAPRAWGIALAVLLCLLIAFATGTWGRGAYEHSEVVMDTVVTLSADGNSGEKAVKESFIRMKEIEAASSAALSDSDAARVSAAAGNHEWISISHDLYYILRFSNEWSKRTDGAWDVTMGPVTKLWGIGTDDERIPTAAEIAKVRERTGWRYLEIKEEDGQFFARLMKPGMMLDLGGIAKGYALDEVRKIYERYGIKNGLINLGASTLYAYGHNAKGKPWRVGLKDPRAGGDAADGKLLGVISLSGGALSTSGDYERFFERDGVRYHHIMDPKTGSPARSGAMAVTIYVSDSVEDSGMLSDILTTAAFVMGPEKGLSLMESIDGVTGCIVSTDHTVYAVPGFDGRIEKLSDGYHMIRQ